MIGKINLDQIDPEVLQKYHLGIEKEGLRADLAGAMSFKQHPQAFGSKINSPINNDRLFGGAARVCNTSSKFTRIGFRTP